MWFLITLAILIYASIMAWLAGNPTLVVICWMVWTAGFLGLESGWLFLALQSVLALILWIRWKVDTTI